MLFLTRIKTELSLNGLLGIADHVKSVLKISVSSHLTDLYLKLLINKQTDNGLNSNWGEDYSNA